MRVCTNERHFQVIRSTGGEAMDSSVCIPKLNEPKKIEGKEQTSRNATRHQKCSLSNTQPETRADQSDTSHIVACGTCHSIESIRTVPGSSKHVHTP